MLKKILLTGGLTLLMGVLVFGAINRTSAKTAAETLNTGKGASNLSNPETHTEVALSQESAEHGGYGNRRNVQVDGSDLSAADSASSPDENDAHGGEGELHELPPVSDSPLSEAEASALAYMREEEKLAHDLYITLYEQWGLNSFANIAASESTHTEAVRALLERYNLPDPASTQVGVFNNPDLAALYNRLLAQGSQSSADALLVGAAVEELDILDLESRLAETTHADIQQVFENLRQASGNHLNAYVAAWQAQTGQSYQAQVMTQEQLAAYLNLSGSGRGNGGIGMGQGTGQGQGGGGRGGRP